MYLQIKTRMVVYIIKCDEKESTFKNTFTESFGG